MDSRQLYERAMQTVQNRRQTAETEALRRRAELADALPGLRRLEQEETALGAAAATLAAAGQRLQAQEKLAALQDAARRRKEMLAQAGKTAQDLAPPYHCPHCRDTGRQNGRACACVQEEMKRLRRQNVNAAGPLRLCRFENFRLEYYPEEMELSVGSVRPRAEMQEILARCRRWAASFSPHSQSLYMFGDAGLGKTHLALSIAGEVLQAGRDVIYVSAQSAFSLIGNFEARGRGEELFASMLHADLLILDDLGTEYVTPYVLAKLYELVNGRLGRPTVYTSNICNQDVLEMRYDEKIVSRLLGECELIRFWGRDIRPQKGR